MYQACIYASMFVVHEHIQYAFIPIFDTHAYVFIFVQYICIVRI